MNLSWSLERIADADETPNRRYLSLLGDAEQQARRWLKASPAARVHFFRNRLSTHGGDEVTVLVDISSAETRLPLDPTVR